MPRRSSHGPVTPMPLRTASTLTFFYALGYPIGALAVSAMSPMAVLVFRFGLGRDPSPRLGVARTCDMAHWWRPGACPDQRIADARGCSSSACTWRLVHGAPAVLGAVVISMNPVSRRCWRRSFSAKADGPARDRRLSVGVARGAWPPAQAGCLPSAESTRSSCCCSLLRWWPSRWAGSISSGSARAWTSGRPRRCRTPRALGASSGTGGVFMPFTVIHNPWQAAGAVAAVVLLNATLCMTHVRAGNQHLRRRGGGDAVRGHPRGRRPAVLAMLGPAARCRDRRRSRARRASRAG